MGKNNILIVDDDEDMKDALKEQLELHKEFVLADEENAEKGMKKALEDKIDLLIMDVELPDMDGRDAVKMLRKNGFQAPIIILTGYDTDVDTVVGLDAGANDYVAKPFKFSVLLARIRAQIRQYELSENVVFDIAGYQFQPNQKTMTTKQKEKIRLTEKETAILKYLYRAEQNCIPREELLESVWGYNENITTHTLETHIYRLRQKIEKNPANAKILQTCNGGYKLIP